MVGLSEMTQDQGGALSPHFDGQRKSVVSAFKYVIKT